MMCGKQTPQSARLQSRYVYLVPDGTGDSPTKVVHAEQQLVSSTYTIKYYVYIRFPNTPVHMHNLSLFYIQISCNK